MQNGSYRIVKDKVIIRIKDRMCDTPTELLSSKLFLQLLTQAIGALSRRNSRLLNIFDHEDIDGEDIRLLIETFLDLTKLPADLVPRVVKGSDQFFRNRSLFNEFVEYLYNYWRETQRLIICDSQGEQYDQRPRPVIDHGDVSNIAPDGIGWKFQIGGWRKSHLIGSSLDPYVVDQRISQTPILLH